MGKRVFDVVVSLVGLCFASPLFVAVAIAIRLDSPGPIFFRGTRVGLAGKPFEILKFRSMASTPSLDGARITRSGDPRVTSVGRWLRRLKLDELPQLVNVLRGDMSLVGPRPEDAAFVALYDERQRRVLSVRPGITSLASIRYRAEEELLDGDDWLKTYVARIMPAKLDLDLQYVDEQSFGLDLRILLRTLAAVCR